MADPRSIMQEFRFLEQKRLAGSLTPAETTRHAALRDLVGFEQPLPARGGFDVNAAAAQLRESLLPAGLRSRPLDAPVAPPAPPAAETTAKFPATPDAPAEPSVAPEPAADALFDPASLGQEVRPQAWNPDAPGYDPDAPFDEAAWIAAGYDPNATYDWSALGEAAPAGPTEAAPPADLAAAFEPGVEPTEPPPLQFGEYDAPGAPVTFDAPVEPPAPPPAEPGDGGWFDDTGAASEVLPPPAPSALGEYDAPLPLTPAPAAGGEPFYGGPEGDSLPGGPPLDLGEAPANWLPEGALDVGFELASDGSFGEQAAPPLPAPWSATEPAASSGRWESAPALDLSTPFQPVPIPAPRRSEPPLEAALGSLEPEEALEPIVEAPTFEPVFEALPAEPAWPPQPAAAPPAVPPANVEADSEPVSLDDLDAAVEIDVPPEIAAAYDSPPLDFGPPPPAPPSPVPPSPVPPPLAPAAGKAAPAHAAPAPGPALTPVPEIVPVPAGGATVVAGAHRVVVHTLDGQVLRGTLTDANLEAAELKLEADAPGAPRAVVTTGVKAIFFMLAPGEKPPVPQGKRVRVAFRDGRQVAGFSPDYQEGGTGFFMIPADTRTNTGRIWVYQGAVKQVSVS